MGGLGREMGGPGRDLGGLGRDIGGLGREVGRGPAQRPGEDDMSDHSSSSSSGHGESIPINVIHERSAGPGTNKHKYSSGGGRSSTTELPVKGGGGDASPRLERAHSEPPNKFNQRLNLARPLYSTIPENGEGANGAAQHAHGPR